MTPKILIFIVGLIIGILVGSGNRSTNQPPVINNQHIVQPSRPIKINSNADITTIKNESIKPIEINTNDADTTVAKSQPVQPIEPIKSTESIKLTEIDPNNTDINYARHKCIEIIYEEMTRLYGDEIILWEEMLVETPLVDIAERDYISKNIEMKKTVRDQVLKVVEELKKTIPEPVY